MERTRTCLPASLWNSQLIIKLTKIPTNRGRRPECMSSSKPYYSKLIFDFTSHWNTFVSAAYCDIILWSQESINVFESIDCFTFVLNNPRNHYTLFYITAIKKVHFLTWRFVRLTCGEKWDVTCEHELTAFICAQQSICTIHLDNCNSHLLALCINLRCHMHSL